LKEKNINTLTIPFFENINIHFQQRIQKRKRQKIMKVFLALIEDTKSKLLINFQHVSWEKVIVKLKTNFPSFTNTT